MSEKHETWAEELPSLLRRVAGGGPDGKLAEDQLQRMADLADLYVKLAVHDGEKVLAMLTDAGVVRS
ncbi:hypothetical protein ELH77_19205 [Rhizobium ruizarguesonis]|uniref:hypothetical protein n=1 Tax=Rhizobium ruizarguesonis TaxID=2081791 RepID=UPI00102FC36D|nr:hypothetical protein [Rhizobium ruizarguesonis]TAZ20735.1 hypothetical protein ELH77_19205 [Rhizobium ruizarguesonis]